MLGGLPSPAASKRDRTPGQPPRTSIRSFTTLYRGNAVSDLAPNTSPTGQRILLVEDSDVVRMLTVEVLEELDYHVSEAAEAQRALEILRSDEHIDLLMTDIGLPGMNGQELAVAARQLRPNLKVLFASGYAESVEIDKNEPATRTDIIGKPFSLDALRDKVQDMLGN
ncbi:response regulator [Pseudomonas sp. MM211]|nr:response regulator [Pseudomonas sp. MM211]